MPETLRLLSLNMECDKHYDTVMPLIALRTPDILCLQEVPIEFGELLSEVFGYQWEFKMRAFVPSRVSADTVLTEGMLIAWKPSLVLEHSTVHTYRAKEKHAVTPTPIHANDVDRSLIVTTLRHGEEVFRIGTTHFTWTPDGGASDEQHRDMDRLLDVLGQFHDEHGIMFSGDFNAPRGGEVFTRLSERYADHVPEHVTSTIDPKLHRAAGIEHVVDGLFSTPHYAARDVEVIDGISDHKAIFAVIEQCVR